MTSSSKAAMIGTLAAFGMIAATSARAVTLEQNYASGDPAGQAIFNELGSGTSYGNFAVSSADSDTTLTLALNSTALTDLQNQEGGLFTIGGFSSGEGTGNFLFGGSGGQDVDLLLNGTTTITTSQGEVSPGFRNQGWFFSDGTHSQGNDNYVTGNLGILSRSFFQFDLSGVTGPITSASFVADAYDVTGPQTLTLDSFAPQGGAPVVPEPSPIAGLGLGALGLGGLAFGARRRSALRTS